jgi:hypothetical protein
MRRIFWKPGQATCLESNRRQKTARKFREPEYRLAAPDTKSGDAL